MLGEPLTEDARSSVRRLTRLTRTSWTPQHPLFRWSHPYRQHRICHVTWFSKLAAPDMPRQDGLGTGMHGRGTLAACLGPTLLTQHPHLPWRVQPRRVPLLQKEERRGPGQRRNHYQLPGSSSQGADHPCQRLLCFAGYNAHLHLWPKLPGKKTLPFRFFCFIYI